MHPDFPGERLIAYRNEDLARKRQIKRDALLAATIKELEKVKCMVERVGGPQAHDKAQAALFQVVLIRMGNDGLSGWLTHLTPVHIFCESAACRIIREHPVPVSSGNQGPANEVLP